MQKLLLGKQFLFYIYLDFILSQPTKIFRDADGKSRRGQAIG